ncbi:MupG family TIM beta-alpha barrel fold protein [Faecalibaculum rodentium]|uniref:DUF871 domain-containing protein n=1 Tax=Faecalibaculum rodentium TaxID=1702221 RepID=A0A1Q9YLG4_9FIRM|nr:MupG family TIM beta-alpha barrel fold protein [Faecalibaculum rodentium]OLU45766.1 hypothetical protein BO223_04055 [Faecalibaculum rodentium]
MNRNLGIARYLSNADTPLPCGNGAIAFTSAHVPEEADASHRFGDLVRKLKKEAGYRVMCDIDDRTPAQFGLEDEEAFLKAFDLDWLRLDDGYTQEQLLDLVRKLPVALNASTIPESQKRDLLEANPDILFVHNFYPKEDTGLDLETFQKFSAGVPAENLVVFIPGDSELRGPLFEGLPTLEEDRNEPPYVSFARFREMGIQQVLVGDPGLFDQQREWIEQAQQGVYSIPCQLWGKQNAQLYDVPFTIRLDSPRRLRRLQESRAYGKSGNLILPDPDHGGMPRNRGDICQDNERFGRYSGEVTLINGELPARDRINTIGRVDSRYLKLLDYIPSGARIMLVREAKEAQEEEQ